MVIDADRELLIFKTPEFSPALHMAQSTVLLPVRLVRRTKAPS